MKRVFSLSLFFIIIAEYSFSAEPVVTREKFYFKSGQETLYGGFVIPNNHPNLPLLVFLPGSGPASSYRTNYANFLKEIFEDPLLIKGIALMYLMNWILNNL